MQMIEKDLMDAPVHMDNEESNAWADGFNAGAVQGPAEFLKQAQAEAKNGFHKDFGWVDENSSIAKFVKAMEG